MKHWTTFLPEAGTIAKYGNDLEEKQNKIISLEKELTARKIELKHEEAKILERAKMEWTEEEIENAKKRVRETQNKIHPVFQNILKPFMP